ncbi:hypothetical protein ARC20_14270 [Stenotrophomonas panacihumi]|uniref:Uncharacterized protein n=2 Tax=Stenotrophomonas panacihumi TaxID=676599 RepID=A0A0R0A0X9_9GAMM|nr:hypothetical protein ARC20_14270 [Stenotrophomonas panacihumi]
MTSMFAVATVATPGKLSVAASVATLAAALLALMLVLALARLLGGWVTRRWHLQRSARIAQGAAALLCGASLLAILVLGFIRPRLLPEAERVISSEAVDAIGVAALVAMLTMPLAWRAVYRWLRGRRTEVSVQIRVPVARVAVLCALSLALVATLFWQGSVHAPLPAPFFPIYIAFVLSLLATALPLAGWALRRWRSSKP